MHFYCAFAAGRVLADLVAAHEELVLTQAAQSSQRGIGSNPGAFERLEQSRTLSRSRYLLSEITEELRTRGFRVAPVGERSEVVG
jgi:hypothetical protein